MPNSLLWVCLVAIWLFVLVPMVVKSRPTVRKTSDAALSTRVLHRGGRTIAKTKRRMASGRHPHDAEWEPPVREYRKVAVKAGAATAVKDADVDVDEVDDEVDVVDADTTEAVDVDKTPVMKKVAVEEDSAVDDADTSNEVEAEADSGIEAEAEADDDADSDADVVDETDDLEDAETDDDVAAEVEDDLDAEADDSEDAELEDAELEEAELEDAEYDDDYEDDDYEDDAEYDDVEEAAVEETEDEDDTDDAVAEDDSARRARRGGFDPEAERRRSDKRYRFRQRVMALLGVLTLLSIGAGLTLGAAGWAATVVMVVALVGYMSFLRRAVRNEQRIFQQRMRRLARTRREEEERRAHPEVDPRTAIPARLRRPGAIVLEIDDEDPIFDHLPRYEHASRVEELDTVPSYRRVVGQ